MADIQHILMNVSTNRGYSADQVLKDSITLGDLLQRVQEAVDNFGEDVKVVLHNGDSYGAAYGVLTEWVDTFEEEKEEEDLYC